MPFIKIPQRVLIHPKMGMPYYSTRQKRIFTSGDSIAQHLRFQDLAFKSLEDVDYASILEKLKSKFTDSLFTKTFISLQAGQEEGKLLVNTHTNTLVALIVTSGDKKIVHSPMIADDRDLQTIKSFVQTRLGGEESAVQKFQKFVDLEKLQPPRPGLVPQTGDYEHPFRWVRPEKKQEMNRESVIREKTPIDFSQYEIGQIKNYFDGNIFSTNPKDPWVSLVDFSSVVRKKIRRVVKERIGPMDRKMYRAINDWFVEDYRSLGNLMQAPEINIFSEISRKIIGNRPIKLYRGIRKKHVPKKLSVGDAVSVKAYPLSSWTTDLAVAKEFGMVISKVINPEEIFLVPSAFVKSSDGWNWQKEVIVRNDAEKVGGIVEWIQ